MNHPRPSEEHGAPDFGIRSEDEADAQWIEAAKAARQGSGGAETREEATPPQFVVPELGAWVLDDDRYDRYDRYVEQGTMSPDEARAHRNGVSASRQVYLDLRRELALQRIAAMPDGPEKNQEIADISRRFPE